MPDLAALNVTQRLALTDAGDLIPIVSMFDWEADKTDDPGEAVTFAAGPDRAGFWYAGRVDDFETSRKH